MQAWEFSGPQSFQERLGLWGKEAGAGSNYQRGGCYPRPRQGEAQRRPQDTWSATQGLWDWEPARLCIHMRTCTHVCACA